MKGSSDFFARQIKKSLSPRIDTINTHIVTIKEFHRWRIIFQCVNLVVGVNTNNINLVS